MLIYTVKECADSPEELSVLLNNLAAQGERIISVTWQPARVIKFGKHEVSHIGGFTLIAEHLADEMKPEFG